MVTREKMYADIILLSFDISVTKIKRILSAENGRCWVLALLSRDDVIKWKPFARYWPFERGIYWSPVDSLTKASDAELWCFLWSAPGQTIDEIIEMIRDANTLIMTSLWWTVTLLVCTANEIKNNYKGHNQMILRFEVSHGFIITIKFPSSSVMRFKHEWQEQRRVKDCKSKNFRI